MDVRKLKSFVVVAEQLNFRRSAEILGMSQPPLTRLIASLEDELDAKLFERTTRQVRLTGAGIVLLKEAREILSSIDRIHAQVRSSRKLSGGSLKIGFSATVFLAKFPTIMDEFASRFPKVEIELQQGLRKELFAGVRAGRLDLCFVESATSEQGLESHRVDDEVLGALLPKNHFLAKRKEIEFNELANETIIMHNRQEAREFHSKIYGLIRGLENKPKVYIKSESEACPILVATGKGVSLTIAGSQKLLMNQTQFVPIKQMFLPVSVFWNSDNPSTSLKTFLSFVIENKVFRQTESRCLHFD